MIKISYCSTKQVVDLSGLGIRIVDELVGTGDSSETDFDLDNDNIISSSYTISYAASGSNSFTELTETTHYTLDAESGRIVLTTAGVTAVGTNNIYASYTYTEIFSNYFIYSLIDEADDEVDQMTGRTWDGPTSYTEYINGRASLGYPTTNAPYADDWDAPDFLTLKNSPVTQVDAVYFLSDPVAVGQVWNYDNSATTYTDYTDNANNTDEDDFTAFASTPAANDLLYIGSSEKFLGMIIGMSTVGTGSPSITWQYYNGSTWANLTVTDDTDGASDMTAQGRFTWSMPSSWTKTSINSSQSLYFVRALVSTGYTVAPIISSIAIQDSVNTIVHPRNTKFESWGRLSFVEVSVPNGTKNVRVDYKYGQSTTPTLIAELSALLVALRCYVNLTGGSYNDATSYTLGSKSVTIGEQYVNIREVMDQFRKRISEIRDLLGERTDIIAI